MNDEKYVFITDCAEKKRTARGIHNKRTHAGKGGKVIFPSDYLTRKEREAMNGEIKTYALNRPMRWKEFKLLPDDVRREYIENLQKRFDVQQKILPPCSAFLFRRWAWRLRSSASSFRTVEDGRIPTTAGSVPFAPRSRKPIM